MGVGVLAGAISEYIVGLVTLLCDNLLTEQIMMPTGISYHPIGSMLCLSY
jgi:hypothetical protein